MNLREKLKNTLLVSPEIKQKLLTIPKWTKEIETTIKEIFIKYGKLEEKILKEVSKASGRFYIKSIQDIENIEKQKEIEELKEIEEKLKNL